MVVAVAGDAVVANAAALFAADLCSLGVACLAVLHAGQQHVEAAGRVLGGVALLTIDRAVRAMAELAMREPDLGDAGRHDAVRCRLPRLPFVS